MVALEAEFRETRTKIDDLEIRINQMTSFQSQTTEGSKAQEAALTDLNTEVEKSRLDLKVIRTNLDLATIEFLSGKDKDVAGPTLR